MQEAAQGFKRNLVTDLLCFLTWWQRKTKAQWWQPSNADGFYQEVLVRLHFLSLQILYQWVPKVFRFTESREQIRAEIVVALSPEEAGKRKRYTRKCAAAITTHCWSQGWRPGCIRPLAFLHTVIGCLYGFQRLLYGCGKRGSCDCSLDSSFQASACVRSSVLSGEATRSCCGSVRGCRGGARQSEQGTEAHPSEGVRALISPVQTLPFAKCHVSTAARGQSALICFCKHAGCSPSVPREMEKCDSAARNDQELTSWCFFFFFLWREPNSGSSRKESSDSFRRQFSLLQSFAMSGAVGTSCGKSQTGVMSVCEGMKPPLPPLPLPHCVSLRGNSSNSSCVLWQII